MYNVPHFKTKDNGEVIAFMKQHPFIILCGVNADGKPVATHIPALVEERDDKLFLLAHVMRKQEHTKAYETNPNVLAIFSSAHTYISAGWYENKQVASTWNYQAVHANGVLKFLDENGLHSLLVRLTDHFENDTHSPASVRNMEEGYVRNMMKAIIAFEIEVTSVEHVFKLSQNRDEKSYENIIENLNGQDAEAKAVADEMQKRKHQIFPG